MSKPRWFPWSDSKNKLGASLMTCFFGLPGLVLTLTVAALIVVMRMATGKGGAEEELWY